MYWKSLIIVLLTVTSLDAQIFVKSGGRGDGSSWGNAIGDIREALEKNNDVRVAAGTYKLDGELNIKHGQTLSGGWSPKMGIQLGNDAERTVLFASDNSRVAKVAGQMIGFTISGGQVVKKNGGGLYITSTGVVEHCIIRDNKAIHYYPKVGDLLCKDGSFLPTEEMTLQNVESVCGIVFWVNPDPNAPEFQRGWAMGLNFNFKEWSYRNLSQNITGSHYKTMAEALSDTMGYSHSKIALASGKIADYPALEYCLNLTDGGRSWYLPAFGQLRTLFAEYGKVEDVHLKIVEMREHIPPFTMNARYASSSEKTGSDNRLWIISSGLGEIICEAYTSNNKIYILPVTSF